MADRAPPQIRPRSYHSHLAASSVAPRAGAAPATWCSPCSCRVRRGRTRLKRAMATTIGGCGKDSTPNSV